MQIGVLLFTKQSNICRCKLFITMQTDRNLLGRKSMIDYCEKNKKAWEYNTYDFWVLNAGQPAERAKQDLENPIGMLKRYTNHFETYREIKVDNGSCGKKAIPLAILGSGVTIFDISDYNSRYVVIEIYN